MSKRSKRFLLMPPSRIRHALQHPELRVPRGLSQGALKQPKRLGELFAVQCRADGTDPVIGCLSQCDGQQEERDQTDAGFSDRVHCGHDRAFARPLRLLYFMPPRAARGPRVDGRVQDLRGFPRKSPAWVPWRGCSVKGLDEWVSERDLAADLPVSRELLTGRCSKRAVCQVVVKKEIWMVEQVVELKPQLEIEPFCYMRVLVCGEIGFREVRLAELLGFLVAVRSRCRGRELPGGKDTG